MAFQAFLTKYLSNQQKKGGLSPTNAINRTAIIIQLFQAKQNFLISSATWIKTNACYLKKSYPNQQKVTSKSIYDAVCQILATSEKQKEAKTATASVVTDDTPAENPNTDFTCDILG
jgi:hypothetical protein